MARSSPARLGTAGLLCQLLREEPAYRRRWTRHTRSPGRGVHQGAVAHVLAEHLRDTGAEPAADDALPRRLKDVVSRALSGKTLSLRVLNLFVDAFDMDEATAERLRELLSGRTDPTWDRHGALSAGERR